MSKYISHDIDKYIVGGLFIILLAVGILFIWSYGNNGSNNQISPTTASSVSTSTPVANDKITALALCLRDKKVVMYGTYYCSHCLDQKKAFGDAWQYVSYVECTENAKLCLGKGVEATPAWITSDGKIHEGEMSLSEVAAFAGCPF